MARDALWSSTDQQFDTSRAHELIDQMKSSGGILDTAELNFRNSDEEIIQYLVRHNFCYPIEVIKIVPGTHHGSKRLIWCLTEEIEGDHDADVKAVG